MRYAIISDLHANVPALEATLDDIAIKGADMTLCLGDLVGYGPSPIEVMELVFGHVDVSILGNHDAVVCNKFSSAYFNTEAKNIIEWTRSLLRPKDIEYIDKLAYMIDGDHFRCSHANFNNPDTFGYVISLEEAEANFEVTKEQLLFLGHTHMAGAHIQSRGNKIQWVTPEQCGNKIKLQSGKRFIVNTGSVGVSRTAEFVASYCIYDSDRKEIEFRQVDFDIDTFRRDLIDAERQELLNYFARIL